MRHLTFVFSGGHLDGLKVSTDSVDQGESDDARTYAVLTSGGRVGNQFKAPTMMKLERILTDQQGGADERYEVVERIDDGGWRWIVRLEAIGPGRPLTRPTRTDSDDSLREFGVSQATLRNAAGTTFPGMVSRTNEVGCWLTYSPYLDSWEYGDGDNVPIPTPVTEEGFRQLLAALRIPQAPDQRAE